MSTRTTHRTRRPEPSCKMARRLADSETAEACCRLWEVALAFSNGVLTLVAFGTPYWVERLTQSDAGAEERAFHEGLWQKCPSDSSIVDCKVLPLVMPAFMMATRLFMVLALVAGLFSWVVTTVALLQHCPRWLFVSALCYGLQAFLMMIALGAFSPAFTGNSPGRWGWSYTVGWVDFLLGLLSAAYFVLVAVLRLHFSAKGRRRKPVYTPLAQFEESTGSEGESADDL